ncbi:MAG: aldehyde dehydrogenase family protein, partial [Phycisphaerales bacterium]|nr:aldehyde dehydrogenase family protein [Phycisphaerales bacterium]
MTTSTAPLASMTIRNPATGAVVGMVDSTPLGEIDGIVARARSAQPAWAAVGLDGRAAAIKGAIGVLKARASELGALACAEMGKPVHEAVGEANYASDGLAEEIDEIVAALRDELLEDEKTSTRLVFDALGVAAVITPWNFPILMPSQSVIPALIAGNTVVMKPSEVSPLSADAWAKC